MIETLPLLLNAPEDVQKTFRRLAIRQSVPAGTVLSREGDACHHFPIVEHGVIRVFKLSRDGHEVTLYRIRAGESCILTLSCLMKTTNFPAHAMVEEDSSVWLVPANAFRSWTTEHLFWRDYVIGYLSRTLNRVIGLVDEMLFRRVEFRLIDVLLAHTTPEHPSLKMTHQDLANEIGSAREVISRNLKDLERDGLLKLSRGEVAVTDRVGLERRGELL